MLFSNLLGGFSHQKGASRSFRGRNRLVILFILFVAFIVCEASWLVSLAPTDITHYECYGLAFWHGSQGILQLPPLQCAFLHSSTPIDAFHMLPQEYPPLTILVFSLPLLIPLPYYALGF